MKHILLFLLAFSFTAIQAQEDSDNLKEATQEYIDAFVGKDFEKLATMTHPNIISMSGNVDFVKQDFETDILSLENMGFKYLDGEVGEPGEIFQSGAEMLCFVPQIYTVELNGEKYISTTHILATSMTKGKVWNFVSLVRQDQNSIGDFVPSYQDKMGWPERTNMEKVDK